MNCKLKQPCYAVVTKDGGSVHFTRSAALAAANDTTCVIKHFLDLNAAHNFVSTDRQQQQSSSTNVLALPDATLLEISTTVQGSIHVVQSIITKPDGKQVILRKQVPPDISSPTVAIIITLDEQLPSIDGKIIIVCSDQLLHTMYRNLSYWSKPSNGNYAQLISRTLNMIDQRGIELLKSRPLAVGMRQVFP